MHTLKLTLAAVLTLLVLPALGQTLDDYKITLRVNGAVVKGTQEIVPEAAASPDPGLVLTRTDRCYCPLGVVQAVVTVTDPSGVTATTPAVRD